MTWITDVLLAQQLAFGFGCCLCFAGLIMFARQFHQSFFLSLCFLMLGVTVMVSFMPAKEASLLIIWPAYYLHVRQRHQRIKWHPFMAPHFVIPVLWGMLRMFGFASLEQWFESVAFLQWVPYILLTLAELYRQFRSTTFKMVLEPAFTSWAFLGLLFIFVVRLLLPILSVDVLVFNAVFQGAFGLYLFGMFSFYVHGPFRHEEWTLQLEKEATSNYEEELKRRLDVLLKREKVYVIPDLTLQELSKKMHIRSAALSGFFSASLGRNFNEVINEYRVEEVKRLMRDPNTDPRATLMELAYQSGFNSKATFNRIFKEMTGMTPKAFKTQATE